MSIIEKTQELGELIKHSEEMKAIKAAEQVQNNDEKAQELLQEYNLKRMNIARDMHNGEIEQEAAMQMAQEAFEVLLQNDSINNYIEAKKKFDAMVQEVNKTLNYYITGEDQNCTHDCGTCGGCH